jgi:hypothetical protein
MPYYYLLCCVSNHSYSCVHVIATSLYMEKIDVGEAEPRQVLSGLANYVPIDRMMGASLLVICNLQRNYLALSSLIYNPSFFVSMISMRWHVM